MGFGAGAGFEVGAGGGEAEDFADGERVIAELIPTAEIFNGDTRLSGDFA